MTVYIEYVIIDNLVVDCLIIYLTLRVMRLKVSKARVLLVAALGTAVAVLLPLIGVRGLLALFIKICVGFLLVAFIASFDSIRQYIRSVAVFFAVTIMLGGACFGILFLLEGDISRAISMGYERIPVGIIIAGVIGAYFLTAAVARRMIKVRDKSPFYCEVKMYLNGQSVEFLGYIDSGNLLYDFKGAPVVVANTNAVSGLLAQSLLRGKHIHMDTLEYSTVSGSDKMRVFKPDKIEVYQGESVNILYDVTVGLTDRDFEDYACLLHPACV